MMHLILLSRQCLGQGIYFNNFLCCKCKPRLNLLVQFGLIHQINCSVKKRTRRGNHNLVCRRKRAFLFSFQCAEYMSIKTLIDNKYHSQQCPQVPEGCSEKMQDYWPKYFFHQQHQRKEIFHSLCKTPFTKSELHKDNPSLVFRNPLQQETLSLLIPFQK